MASNGITVIYINNDQKIRLLAEEICKGLGESCTTIWKEKEELKSKKDIRLFAEDIKEVEANGVVILVDEETLQYWENNGVKSAIDLLNEDEEVSSKKYILFVGCGLEEEKLDSYLEKLSEPTPAQICFQITKFENMSQMANEIVEMVNNQCCPTVEQVEAIKENGVDEKPLVDEKNEINESEPDRPIFTAGPVPDKKEEEEEDAYKIENPGLCLVLTLTEYDSEDKDLDPRIYSKKDMENMDDCFARLGCRVEKKLNPTKDEAESFLNNGLRLFEDLDCGFLVVVISTHGQEVEEVINKQRNTKKLTHQLFFHDGLSLKTEDIVKKFDKLKKQRDVPCFFFIQACRSRMRPKGEEHLNVDEGVKTTVQIDTIRKEIESVIKDRADAKRGVKAHSDKEVQSRVTEVKKWQDKEQEKFFNDILDLGNSLRAKKYDKAVKCDEEVKRKIIEELTDKNQTAENIQKILEEFQGYEYYILEYLMPPVTSVPAPCFNDSLIMFASPSGKIAYNRDKKGGWLLFMLYDQFKETLDSDPHKVNLLSEMIKVCNRMALEETDKGDKSVPCVYHKLCKDIIIQPQLLKLKLPEFLKN